MKSPTDFSRENFNALSKVKKQNYSSAYAQHFSQKLLLELEKKELDFNQIKSLLLDYAFFLSHVSFINADLYFKIEPITKALENLRRKVPPAIYNEWMLALVKQDPRVIFGMIPIIPSSTRNSPEFEKMIMHEYRMRQAQWIGGFSIGLGVASVGILIMQHVILASPYVAIPSLVIGIAIAGMFASGYHQDQLIQTIAQDPFFFDSPRL